MQAGLRLLVVLVGVFNLLIGLSFLIDPERGAAQFFVSPLGGQGLATLRADFPGFFITGGTFALLGALRRDRQALLVPALLLALALLGRCVSLVADGTPATAYPPMAAEAVMIALVLGLRRTLGAAR